MRAIDFQVHQGGRVVAGPSTATIAGRIRIRGDGGYSTVAFNVADGGAQYDLTVATAIQSTTGLTKTGGGTLRITGTQAYTGAVTVGDETSTTTLSATDNNITFSSTIDSAEASRNGRIVQESQRQAPASMGVSGGTRAASES